MTITQKRLIREHDRDRRHERWAMRVVTWFVRHDWLSGWTLAGYGLAEMGYTDRPEIGPDTFRIDRTGRSSDVETADPSGQ